MAHVSTSYAECANLTMRMHNRRFTRLTNAFAFSKKFENHAHMVAIYAVWYNFLRIHKNLRVTPAMAAGLSATVMDWAEIVEAMDAASQETWTLQEGNRSMIRIIFLSMLLPVALTLSGPIFYGYSHAPHWRVTVWALASVPVFLWYTRSSFRNNFRDQGATGAVLGLVVIAIVAAAFFMVGDYAAYFLVRSISN